MPNSLQLGINPPPKYPKKKLWFLRSIIRWIWPETQWKCTTVFMLVSSPVGWAKWSEVYSCKVRPEQDPSFLTKASFYLASGSKMVISMALSNFGYRTTIPTLATMTKTIYDLRQKLTCWLLSNLRMIFCKEYAYLILYFYF